MKLHQVLPLLDGATAALRESDVGTASARLLEAAMRVDGQRLDAVTRLLLRVPLARMRGVLATAAAPPSDLASMVTALWSRVA